MWSMFGGRRWRLAPHLGHDPRSRPLPCGAACSRRSLGQGSALPPCRSRSKCWTADGGGSQGLLWLGLLQFYMPRVLVGRFGLGVAVVVPPPLCESGHARFMLVGNRSRIKHHNIDVILCFFVSLLTCTSRAPLRVARAVAQRTWPNFLFCVFLCYTCAYDRGLCHCSAFFVIVFSFYLLLGSISICF